MEKIFILFQNTIGATVIESLTTGKGGKYEAARPKYIISKTLNVVGINISNKIGIIINCHKL